MALLAMSDGTAPRWHYALLAAVFAALYVFLLQYLARFYWFVPAGLRVAALALLPLRAWPYVMAGEFVGRILGAVVPTYLANMLVGPFSAWMLTFLAPTCSLPGSWLLHRVLPPATLRPSLATVRGMGWLLTACLASALCESGGNLLNMHFDHDPWPAGMGAVRFTLGKITGDYIGVIALAPAIFTLWPSRDETRIVRPWRSDFLLLTACAIAYVALMRAPVEAVVYDYAQVLVLAPAFVIATRHGWRGAALALSVCSFLVALVPALHPLDPFRNLFTQMLLALFGSAALLLGAAIDAFRTSQRDLMRHNEILLVANARLDRAADDLRSAARRNLSLAEDLRRHITAELHDELGQTLTALQTRLKLAEREDAAAPALLAPIRDQVTQLRRSLSGLMANLRPLGLDEFGLVHTLRHGPIRTLVEAAGLAWELRIDDDEHLLDVLDNDSQTALYRIVQEAAGNTVRHAQATRFRVRLRARGTPAYARTHDANVRDAPAHDALAQARGPLASAPARVRVGLAISDDGIGFATDQRAEGVGLLGMHDRVLSLGGRLRLASDAAGTRLSVALWFAPKPNP